MKTILFPTDFSDNAKNAYVYALHLAEKIGANITTLHVQEPTPVRVGHLPKTMKSISELQKEEEFEAYRKVAAIMHEEAVTEGLTKVEVSHMMIEGAGIAEAILEVGKREESDVIVMGTKGASGWKELFIGSNTAKVIEQATCPVLAIPESAIYQPIKKIAYATNFEFLEEEIIGQAIQFAELFDAEMHCIHINVSHTDYAKKKMEDLKVAFAYKENVYFKVIEDLYILEGIDKYVLNEKIDLLAMLTHKRDFLDKLFTVSYTQKMSFHSNTPLLAFHNEA